MRLSRRSRAAFIWACFMNGRGWGQGGGASRCAFRKQAALFNASCASPAPVPVETSAFLFTE